MITKLLAGGTRDLRVAALRIAERWLGVEGHPMHAEVLALMDDPDPAVRRQLAATLGVLPLGSREDAIGAFLEKRGDDPIALDAALTGVRGSEAVLLEKLARAGGELTPAREAAIAMLAAMIVRSGQDVAAQDLFSWIAERGRTAAERSALLRGAEIALLGSPMPGTPSAQRPVVPPAPKLCPICRKNPASPNGGPCSTCPGGRAGPGGSFAFRPASPRSAVVGPVLRLSREPASFAALARRDGDLEARAKRVLDRIEWPGKPGAAAPVPPLSAQEQQRYAAGSQLYKNLCQGCHLPDGRGLDNAAPSLIGSSLALGPASITSRILLNGKEGKIGLMPPLGATLDDDAVAAVLTYIRREWGQAGSPVDPAAVKSVRELTASRARPWTEEELINLMESAANARQGPK